MPRNSTTLITFHCATCGKPFTRYRSQVIENNAQHCSRSCQFPLSPAERFWTKVRIGSGCWLWMDATDKDGYGKFWDGRATVRATRFVYSLTYGSLPDELDACHTCDTPTCVRPSHLFAGTNAENHRDKQRKGRAAKGDGNGSHLHPETLQRGELHHAAKLTAPQVAAIRALHAAGGTTYTAIARQFGMDASTITAIVRREIWRHLP